ncbi:hypothetical protein V1525DRAFT_112988 [Lipomyces kononenkoae]|uniref:Uncharacterized protein n=1 Tax=Lipomyces kononenkoae TaxID=34357 RepID=A0ACC3T628_LIPKO
MASAAKLHTSVRQLTGAVPPQLVGPATTRHDSRIFVHGGKDAKKDVLSTALYVLDLTTYEWTQLYSVSTEGSGSVTAVDDGPSGRYFHSLSYCDEQLFVFGGLIGSAKAASELWCFNLHTKRWSLLPPAHHDLPTASRWAHCSCVCGNALVLLGGQDTGNHYIGDITIYDIRRGAWARPRAIPSDGRYATGYGSYRSVLIPASTTQQSTSRQAASAAMMPASSIYLYSNTNFDGVPDITLDLLAPPGLGFSPVPINMTDGPPFLRFPTGGVLGDNIIIGGTYLSVEKQEYSIYAYNLRTKLWTKLEYDEASALSSSSWNTSFFCSDTAKHVLLGTRVTSTSLLQDYNDRITNFVDVLEIEVEGYGVFANAADSGVAFSRGGQMLGREAMRDGLADMEIICFDSKREGDNDDLDSPQDGDGISFLSRTKRIGVLSKVLETRWGEYYLSLCASAPGVSGSMRGNNRVEDKSRVLFIPERYEIVAALVEWLYTGTLDPSWDVGILGGLLSLARAYRISVLRRQTVLGLHELLETSHADDRADVRETVFSAAAAAGEVGLLKLKSGHKKLS